MAHAEASSEPMPIIVGVPRSGTTLLRFMLESHPRMAIPPETGFLACIANSDTGGAYDRHALFRIVTGFPPEAPGWHDFGIDAEQYWGELQRIEPFTAAEGVRAFYRLYAERQRKPRYGEKTPGYCEHISVIGRMLPEARFVHIIRDGRDVALSLRPMWFAPGRDMRTLATYWLRLVRHAREAGCRSPAYMEIRYEELVTNPRPVLERLCGFLRLDFHPVMLRYWERTPGRLKEHGARLRPDRSIVVTHEQRVDQQRRTMCPPEPARAFRWRLDMTTEECTEFVRVAGDMLEELGYAI